MPLNPETLATEIRKINDRSFEQFEGFPTTNGEVGDRWAKAVRVFFEGLTFPPLVPGTLELAEVAFAASLTGALGAAVGPVAAAGVAAFPLAFKAFGAAIVPGALPTNIALPPPADPVFALPISPAPEAAAVAATIASIVFAWAKTGVAGAAPTGLPVNPWG